MSDFSVTQENVIYYCYLFGSFYLFFISIILGEFFPAILFILSSAQALFWIIAFSVTGKWFHF
jgi:hypothetical protein